MSVGWAGAVFDFEPFRLSGTVYGALMNHRTSFEELGPKVNGPPYNCAPRAPVLYIKPRNTLARSGDAVGIPVEVAELEVGACLGVILGRVACRVPAAQAFDSVAGFLLVNDVCVPHEVFYRPSIRLKARDGFCPLGGAVPRAAVPNPDDLTIRTYVDGGLVQTSATNHLVRSVAQLIADVTEFMTLQPGDILSVGAARPSPRVRAGQRVEIAIDGFPTLSNRFEAELS